MGNHVFHSLSNNFAEIGEEIKEIILYMAAICIGKILLFLFCYTKCLFFC